MILDLLKKYTFEELWDYPYICYWKNESEKRNLALTFDALLAKEPCNTSEKQIITLVPNKNLHIHPRKYMIRSYINDDPETYFSFNMLDWNIIVSFDYELTDFPEQIFLLEFLYEVSYYGSELQMMQKKKRFQKCISTITKT